MMTLSTPCPHMGVLGTGLMVIAVSSVVSAQSPQEIFDDGFEWANTYSWSVTVPAVDPCLARTAAASDDFSDPSWESNSGTTFWQQASWMQNGTQMSPDRCEAVNGNLELTVLAGSPFRGGSIQTRHDAWEYGRWDARLRPSPVPGALNSMFTMDWNGASYEEVDIEFLTYTFGEGAGSIHLAVHEDGQTNYYWEDVPLPFDPSQSFHLYSIEKLPDRVSWYVDGEILRTFFYDAVFVHDQPYQFFFNAWTKETWINGPPLEDAVYQIDWVRFYPYICTAENARF